MNPVTPTNLGETILNVFFYLIIAAFLIYSIIAIYSLLRYGRTKILSISVIVVYLIISAGLYAAAVSSLNQIK
ncbi:MAG: hypothetical protein A3I07_02440 [Candidatus Doudnabacteria bacterium RIFCSPLOWO2_02_FULL_42_9]|uniref:Uncharacterized protein n=1 Tax=Candidatus Doudnabacteria bacterium RIFCSPHIGHO2_01_FULL_41_86 TaxID=1817821 RepID=A0A1F5N7M7_9BACT|nr:MAG: hypothetical protein A2717_03150 [Candidatus Doudnabacteria bacterium RIFCSPHIGHO2_01_FULL_41_86]OGE74691.1 MAG: hypothetical protein A3K07_02745 [Candidatus Doudnabacteria bacterium RIFCSPHIGHO2_01_43_10]OGE85050.1 MAG: hypothetical protein A3E28_04555 [Candidatus Doudnabacteria bacterium RIFCSPHIGHO2_12_FULL_42_22]OGE86491.1 MAG: hypothetical protein A3C49_04735 [Candidatus Doudnabacteria bacterium RIFCSPHIGHO2_02_FULL_42_25]OGE91953.1 MAG: hypothetical protein A2895_01500 [Candidatus